MPKDPPESMRHHLRRRLNRHARERWPHVDAITVRFRTGFAYVAAELPGGESLPLCRPRFTGAPHAWGFALHLAGSDSCRDDILPSGLPAGSPEEALDRAGDLCLSALKPALRVPAGLVVLLNALKPAVRMPAGLVVLVGPPASGKTSFVRALIARGQIDAEAVVSSDEIRAELFGASPEEAKSDAADARIFEEHDRRIVARLVAGRTAVADSTKVTPQARTRLIADRLARRHLLVELPAAGFDPQGRNLAAAVRGQGGRRTRGPSSAT